MQLSTLTLWIGALIEVSAHAKMTNSVITLVITSSSLKVQPASALCSVWSVKSIIAFYNQPRALMELHAWIIQSEHWCAQSVFENFTPQRLAAQIRTELRWTTASCQWITHFTAGNRHDTVKILALQHTQTSSFFVLKRQLLSDSINWAAVRVTRRPCDN